MSQVAMNSEPAPWPMSLFSPRTSPSLAPAQPQPQPEAGSPSAHRLSPGGFSLAPETLFLGSPGGARGAPKGTGISVGPIPARSRSQTLPPPDIAPSSPQAALPSPALPSPAPEELSEGYDADEVGGKTEDAEEEGAEEDTADKASVPHTQKDAGGGAEPESGSGAGAVAGVGAGAGAGARAGAGSGADCGEADGGAGSGAGPIAEGDAGGSDRGATGGGAEGGSAHVGAGSGSEQAGEAGDSGGEAVGLEAAPGVGGGDAAEVVASRPLGHLRCANVDEAEVAEISHLLLMALAEAVVEKRKGDMFPRPLETLAESARKELCTFLDSHGTGAGAGAGGAKGAAHRTPGGMPSGTPEMAPSGAPFGLPAPSLALALDPPGNQPGQGNMGEPVQATKHAAGEGEGEAEDSSAAMGSPQPDALVRSSSSSTGEAARPNGSGAPTGLPVPSKGAGGQAVQPLAGPENAGGPEQTAAWELNGGNVDAAVRQTLASSPPQPQSPNGVPSGVPITSPSQGASASPLDTGAGGLEQWKEGEWVPPPLQVAPQVEKLLEEFVASQLTLLTRLSSAFGATNRAAVEGAAGELEAARVWEGEMRRDLARVLIQRMDVNHQGHCGREFVGEQDLRCHEPGCPYKAGACPHAPCQVSLSRKHLGPHQELCPHRLLPCRQGCAEAVPRGVMAAHCGSTCPMRVLPCPFAALPGCACGLLLQRDLPAHLGREAQAHQLLMLQAVVANQELGRSLSQRFGLLEKAQELHDKAMELELRGVHVKLAEVGSRVDKVQGRVDKVERGLAKGSQDWRQQQGVLKREAEALKLQVQGLLK